ncbi:MAG: ribosome recycling factor [Patescibacteria group bacterium]
METIIKTCQEKLEKVLEFFENDIRTIRTGRASSSLVEDVKVESYGSTMRIKDVASITVPDAASLVISPWDKGVVKAVEDGLRIANLGFGVVNMGETIRVTLPELSAERRDELKKMVHRKAEDAKVAMRNARRDAIDEIKSLEKKKELSEDAATALEEKVQKGLDAMVVSLEKAVEAKEKEITL